jgi:hypothetical protein
MFESIRGIVVAADLADAASLVLKAAVTGSFGAGPLAIVSVAERLRPAGLPLEGQGRCTTEELLLDGRAALTNAAISARANMALLGVEFSPGLSPPEESEALAAGTTAMSARYDPVIVLNKHLTLAPVLRGVIRMASGVIIIAAADTLTRDIRTVAALSKGFGKLPALWFNCRGSEAAQAMAVRVSAETSVPLWGTSLSIDQLPELIMPEEGDTMLEPRETTLPLRTADPPTVQTAPQPAAVQPAPSHPAVQPAPSHPAVQPAPSHPAVQPAPSHPAPAPDGLPGRDRLVPQDDELITVVREYVGQLQSLRQFRRQLTGTREEVRRLLRRMSEVVEGGGVPGLEDVGDLSRRRGVLEDLSARHEQTLKRCGSEWAFLQKALDPFAEGNA